MGEILFIFLIMMVVAVCAFTPLGYSIMAYSKQKQGKATTTQDSHKSVEVKVTATKLATPAKLAMPEDSVLKRHFLAQLQNEIEAALFPRPTDAVLQRHYDTLVANEIESRIYGR